MRKLQVTSFLIMVIFIFGAVPTTGQTGSGISIAIVYSTGGKGDLSFNDAAFRGIQEIEEKYPDITVAESEPTTVDEINTAIESFAAEEKYDLIIGIGFTAFDGVTASATKHVNQSFMIVDSVVDLPNVASVVFAEHEGSFLAGAMAAMVSTSGTLGFLGGLDIPLINKFRYGYEQGAKYINPDVKVLAAYSPNPDNPWGDLSGGKTTAETFIEQGADVIFAAAGGTGIGVIQAANETDGVYAIGVDSNQDYLAEGKVLTSMVKKVEVAVSTQIEAVVKGTWENGLTVLGVKEGGVGITDMEYTQAEAQTEYVEGKTRIQIIEEIKQKIIDGDIVVSEDSGTPSATTSFGELVLKTPASLISNNNPLPISMFTYIGIFGAAFITLRRRR